MRPVTADSMWTYENGVLKNKLEIKEEKLLTKIEEEMLASKLKEVKIDNFNKEDLLKLHKYLFEDLYDFAGKLRDENVAFNNVMMCQYQVVDLCLSDLLKEKLKAGDDIALALAYFYSELLIIFPFRDGNTVTIQTFLKKWLETLGYTINFNNIDNGQLTNATKHSFYEDLSELKTLFSKYIKAQKNK